MKSLVNDVLDTLEKRGYYCTANYVNKECCGEMYIIPFTDEDLNFTLMIKEDIIEMSQLQRSNLFISYARYNNTEELDKFLNYIAE